MYVCVLDFQTTHKEFHFESIKHILRFLNGTLNYGIWFTKGSNYSLVGFYDSDFAECKYDRKSTSGTCHFFRNYLVSLHIQKQHNIALCTADVVYIDFDSY